MSVVSFLGKKVGAKKKRFFSGHFSVIGFLSAWIRRIVYSMFFVMAVYLVIGLCTILIPSVMGYVIGSFGYTVANGAEFLLAGLSGLFFTAWVFFGSVLLLRRIWSVYMRAMKGTVVVGTHFVAMDTSSWGKAVSDEVE